ncbi:MAG: hypothetical protein IJN04_01700 [Clostridia bacterium]|nr:hypothetical protein [Clostridia bacterium]
MKHNMENFMKGVGMGMALGCTAGVVGTYLMNKNKKGIKHNAGKAIHSFGDLLENVTGMF